MPDAPNLLFTNAGMNQFVPIFLGGAKPQFRRAADTQKCIRAGGKHNDLDDVGFDTYHHTFFEMLGNWSFGDYFKEESIAMAWELLTKIWKFPKERLYATVYSPGSDEPSTFDGEAYGCWKKIFTAEGMDWKTHIVSGSKKDNFWMMGDSGPCGPCTEIHMDLTPGGNTNGSLVNNGSPWCIELWNLVFIQFNACGDGTFQELSEKHVDTGMGLERIVGIIAKTKNFSDFSKLPSNYDSDLFADIFAGIEKMCEKKYGHSISASRKNMSPAESTDFWFRAIADHVRTLTFAICDSIFPSNEGRGYVLRRILRRAVMFGRLLQLPGGFFTKLSTVVVGKMQIAFPELAEHRLILEKVLANEESSFSRTIDRGISIFNEMCHSSGGRISGDDAFLLYDTYGFPIDLTQLMAAERGILVDGDGFASAMERQRSLGRSAQKKSTIEMAADGTVPTEFIGYDLDFIENVPATITAIAISDEKIFLTFSRTPFYAECGGQIGDVGTVEIGENIFHVTDVQRDKNGCYLHEIKETIANCGEIIGQRVTLSVDRNVRRDTARNHSATHLLDFALRKIFGTHIKQAGSCVDSKRLRFDFNAFAPPTDLELEQIEMLVCEKISSCIDCNVFETAYHSIPEGCIANFGEKYGDVVRVVSFGDFSMELCGGCHVKNTAEICCFKIVASSAIAAGVRRIEAVTGPAALALFMENCKIVGEQCAKFSCRPRDLFPKLCALVDHCKELEKTIKVARQTVLRDLASEIASSGDDSAADLRRVQKFIDGVNSDELRQLAMDVLRHIESGSVVLTTRTGGKYSVVACCSKSAIDAGFSAATMVKEITTIKGGSGGGRPEFAMGGYQIS
jgi:alanyl-tRNA synthetase